MRIPASFLLFGALFFGLHGNAMAGDFDWLDALSISATKNGDVYHTRLALRFHMGETEVKTVVRNSGGEADAYMVLRLAEISHQPREKVITAYKRYGKRKAWGRLAKSLGIKPGSRAFHNLKRGHDLGPWDSSDHHRHSQQDFHKKVERPPHGNGHHHKGGNR